MEDTCVFCRIIRGELPAQVIERTETTLVIADRAPQAPIHWLAIPLVHVEDLRTPAADDAALLSGFMSTIHSVVATHAENQPFKLVINNGFEAGQRVFHLHAHVLIGTHTARV
jgi:histidine triad (HIT) family protein